MNLTIIRINSCLTTNTGKIINYVCNHGPGTILTLQVSVETLYCTLSLI